MYYTVKEWRQYLALNKMVRGESTYDIILDGKAGGRVEIEIMSAELKQGLFDRDDYKETDKKLDDIKKGKFKVEIIFPLVYTAISIIILIWRN